MRDTVRESYVYVIFLPNGTPCYVGKGRGCRLRQHHRSHNKRLREAYQSAGGDLPVIVVRDRVTDIEACEIEIALISVIGRLDKKTGLLFNRTEGGDGTAGYIQSDETKELHSITSRLWNSTAEAKEVHRQAAIRRWQSEGVRQKNAERVARYHASMTDGERHKRSENISMSVREAFKNGARERLRNSRVGKPLTSAQKSVLDYMAEANRTLPHKKTPARQAALDKAHQANRGRVVSEATKMKMKASQLARYARARSEIAG